jgi:hypothetical protein
LIAAQLRDLSPAVDDLVSSLYPPVRLLAVQTSCLRLATAIRLTLNTIKEVFVTPVPSEGGRALADEDTKWLDFLYTALDHNMDKVTKLVGSMQTVD